MHSGDILIFSRCSRRRADGPKSSNKEGVREAPAKPSAAAKQRLGGGDEQEDDGNMRPLKGEPNTCIKKTLREQDDSCPHPICWS